jgi:hypothetical protein
MERPKRMQGACTCTRIHSYFEGLGIPIGRRPVTTCFLLFHHP